MYVYCTIYVYMYVYCLTLCIFVSNSLADWGILLHHTKKKQSPESPLPGSLFYFYYCYLFLTLMVVFGGLWGAPPYFTVSRLPLEASPYGFLLPTKELCHCSVVCVCQYNCEMCNPCKSLYCRFPKFPEKTIDCY